MSFLIEREIFCSGCNSPYTVTIDNEDYHNDIYPNSPCCKATGMGSIPSATLLVYVKCQKCGKKMWVTILNKVKKLGNSRCCNLPLEETIWTCGPLIKGSYIDHRKIDSGIPFGEVPGDSQYIDSQGRKPGDRDYIGPLP